MTHYYDVSYVVSVVWRQLCDISTLTSVLWLQFCDISTVTSVLSPQELAAPRLGPYADECQLGGRRVSLQLTPAAQLRPGTNPARMLAGKVVCSIPTEDNVPL